MLEPASYSGTTTLAAALGWAAAGRRVFPTIPGAKQPAVQWSTASSTDEVALLQWFDVHGKFTTVAEDYGLGLPTGDGLIVIDVDLAKGAEIPDWLPATYTVRTQSGGLHFYYRVEGHVPNSAGRLGESIDVRGDGGYVLAPPTPGYRVLVAQPVAPLDALDLTAVQRSTGAFTRERFAFPEDGEKIGEGERNDWLMRACGHGREAGLDDPDLLLEWAEAINEKYIDPPLDQAEVAHVVRSSLRYLGA